MNSVLISFFSSLTLTLLIIRFQHLHDHLSLDIDIYGPQKFHQAIVPRIGGISIAFGLFLAVTLGLKNKIDLHDPAVLLISAIPTFAVGITEDLTKKVSIQKRLIFTAISSALMISLLEVRISRLDVPFLDVIFNTPFAGIFLSIFAITGLANAYNIIDGFHGLSSMVGIITLIAIAYMGFIFSDPLIIYLSLIMVGALLGFFIWNYPRGLIFLGDGGAYLIGFWIASLSILLTCRHHEISPWFALAVNGYPVIETIFTIYRRRIHQGKNVGHPDGIHLHTLIYRRILLNAQIDKNLFSANARTAPYLWVLASIIIAPAVLFWQSSCALIASYMIYTIFYVALYRKIIQFKTPKWLLISKKIE